ncbi:hypothetical protein [uncultured Granulicatella sp.]|uniref:hypothetical protein n=1 Tax=uncultured Granulicatella sp. TaxID=316089 RepID=UPI002059CBA6|nr:hypothetical protein [uncultured Granulicatella sp.]DAM48583.1 MAG TPA: hypothetical protein [Caudoviricetes sp.]
MSHKVTNKEREYVLKVLNETLEYENEEKFEVEYTLMAIAKMIENVLFITGKRDIQGFIDRVKNWEVID